MPSWRLYFRPISWYFDSISHFEGGRGGGGGEGGGYYISIIMSVHFGQYQSVCAWGHVYNYTHTHIHTHWHSLTVTLHEDMKERHVDKLFKLKCICVFQWLPDSTWVYWLHSRRSGKVITTFCDLEGEVALYWTPKYLNTMGFFLRLLSYRHMIASSWTINSKKAMI